jgi:hypothetical protein
MLDFNRDNLAATPISVAINAAIERARPPEINTRLYLGASSIGSPCARQVQFDWMCDPVHDGQTLDIFQRGHLFEDMVRGHMIHAGFEFAPTEKLGFSTFGGTFCGHADGILVRGPALPGVGYPAVWEHKCLGDKGWRGLDRDGLVTAYPHYAAQVLMYQHHLGITEQPRLHGHKREHLRAAACAAALRRGGGTRVDRPRRNDHRGDARRRAAAAPGEDADEPDLRQV